MPPPLLTVPGVHGVHGKIALSPVMEAFKTDTELKRLRNWVVESHAQEMIPSFSHAIQITVLVR